MTSAQDAKFNLDGLDLTRSSNSVGDVIPGATVKLLSGTAASPGTTDLNISQNSDSIVAAVNAFATAYNAITDFVTAQNQFTAPTDTTAGVAGTSAPLFGNSTLNQIQDQLSQALTAVSGSTTLQSIGVTLDNNGDLQVDSNALTTALQSDPTSVSEPLQRIRQVGQRRASSLSRPGRKRPRHRGPATRSISRSRRPKAVGTAGTVFGGTPSTAPETLTFGGALFPAGVKADAAGRQHPSRHGQPH